MQGRDKTVLLDALGSWVIELRPEIRDINIFIFKTSYYSFKNIQEQFKYGSTLFDVNVILSRVSGLIIQKSP